MEENTKSSAEVAQKEKLSYEQLEQVAHQLSDQAKQLYTKLQKSNLDNLFKRLDFLFKVLKHQDSFSTEFVVECVNEIENIIRVPEKSEETVQK